MHSTFAAWVRNHGKTAEAKAAEGAPTVVRPVEFFRLTRGGGEGSSEVAVVVGQSRILVRRGFDPQLLRDVVAALSTVERAE